MKQALKIMGILALFVLAINVASAVTISSVQADTFSPGSEGRAQPYGQSHPQPA